MTDGPPDTKAVPGAISDLYREIATETTPEALDESILAEARRSVSKRPVVTWPWYRPAVFIGLFGLSLALLIEFSALDSVEPGMGVESQTGVDTGTDTIVAPKAECAEEERADAATWWACVQELEAIGNSSAAEEELRRLLAAFPGFDSNAPAGH